MMMVIIHKTAIRIHHTPVISEAIDEKRNGREINDTVFCLSVHVGAGNRKSRRAMISDAEQQVRYPD